MCNDIRAKKISETYNIEVIGIDNKKLIYNLHGYTHIIGLSGLSKVKLDNPNTMTDISYLKYLNNTKFSNSPLEAVSIEGNIITVINTETNAIAYPKRGFIDKDALLIGTSKVFKYRKAIMETLGEKYIYDKCFPEKETEYTTITCPIHGDFSARVTNLIYNKSGCPCCACETKGFSKTQFREACIKNNQAGNGTLYFIKITKGEESFLKVGITSFPDLRKRCIELRQLGCAIEEILLNRGWADDIYRLEKYIHRSMRNKKYLPSFNFKGRQECYSLNAEEEIKEIIRKRFKNCL